MSATLYIRDKEIYPRDDEVDFSDTECPNCGHRCFRRDCWDCGGEGCHDGYEDDPLWYDPGDMIPCDTCDGEGWHHWCPLCGWDLMRSERFNTPRHRGMAIMKPLKALEAGQEAKRRAGE